MTKSTPSGTEDRLRRALEARADQVTTHSLRGPVIPARAARRRRWAPAALLSAAAVAVVAAGALVVRSASDHQDTPPVAPDRVETSGSCRREARLVTQALTGEVRRADIDGDGAADDVAVAVDDRGRQACRGFVGVRTAAGTTYSAAFDPSALPAGPIGPRIMGFPDLGDAGAEIVVDTAARADSALAQLFTLTDAGLVRVAVPGSEDGNFVVEGGGVTYPDGAGCTADRALVLSTASAVAKGARYEVTRRTYDVTGDDLTFTGPESTSRNVPAARLTKEFPEFGSHHFDACPPR
jgi:hypothetical protein